MWLILLSLAWPLATVRTSHKNNVKNGLDSEPETGLICLEEVIVYLRILYQQASAANRIRGPLQQDMAGQGCCHHISLAMPEADRHDYTVVLGPTG
jgi:hypothetical protein